MAPECSSAGTTPTFAFAVPFYPCSLGVALYMARLAIFTSEEQRLFELPPLFNNVDRKRFFFLPESLLEETKHFDNPHNKVYFYLMYGYFLSLIHISEPTRLGMI